MGSSFRSGLAAKDLSAAYQPHQVSDAFDFDLSEIDIQDVRYMNRIHQGIYQNKFHCHLSSTIALHGVKVRFSLAIIVNNVYILASSLLEVQWLYVLD